MPELRCTVQNCMHNQNYYCNLDAIQVGGDKAKNAADTCCDSFEERKSGTFTNASMGASPLSTIDCKAQNAVITKTANVMPEKSVWKAAGHVPAKTPSVLLSSAVKTQELGQRIFRLFFCCSERS